MTARGKCEKKIGNFPRNLGWAVQNNHLMAVAMEVKESMEEIKNRVAWLFGSRLAHSAAGRTVTIKTPTCPPFIITVTADCRSVQGSGQVALAKAC